MVRYWRVLLALLCLATGSGARAADITVFAAASLTDALKEIGDAYRSVRGDTLRSSFASSATLARQIEAGAPADIYMSADQKWMDYLAARGLIETASRRDLLGNSLVLVAPAGSATPVPMRKGNVPAFTGRLCMGDPASVPAGIYGKQSLVSLGWWETLSTRVVTTEDVRTVLAFVARGECPLGIVYATDARVSDKVVVVGRFAAGSHEPVVYPVALLPHASSAARAFFVYLQGPAARQVFERHGFVVLSGAARGQGA
ncbi:MAG TPA: molybdate ABC transporter substrate-binding protein [Moraxellaceae bacterium]|nr:molybdate ABC transporter substrate-binding protein [Moraxellaceae bacterium]